MNGSERRRRWQAKWLEELEKRGGEHPDKLKPCRTCGKEFEPTEAQRKKCDYQCKPCRREYCNEWYARNKPSPKGRKPADLERRKKYKAEWYQRNKERTMAAMRSNPVRLAARRASARASYQRRKLDPQARAKIRARQAINSEVKYGRVTRLPCEVCGEPKTEAHHDDYAKPLEVRWLCKTHHEEHHRKDGAA